MCDDYSNYLVVVFFYFLSIIIIDVSLIFEGSSVKDGCDITLGIDYTILDWTLATIADRRYYT